MDKIIITITGFGLIAAIYWFFFGKNEESIEVKNTWNIRVEGGYQPRGIKIPLNKVATLTFTRKDPNSCLEDVIIPDFKIKTSLPLNKPVTIKISPTKTGTFGFHCSMNMYRGTIEVV